MPQKILGIDLGSYSIKVAEMERSFRTFSLVGFYEQPVVSYETLGKEGSMAQALVKLFEEYNLSGDLVYTALPGQVTSVRVIDLPFADSKKVDQTIEFELENYLPLPLEELLIDYQILSAAEGRSTVLVSYAKKSELVKYLNLLNGVDLDPRFVGCEPVELANVLKLGVIHPEGAYALLDLGHEKTNVSIFTGSSLHYARTIMSGGKDLTRAIAEKMNIPLPEAERMKVEVGQLGPGVEGADSSTRAVSEAMNLPLQDLLLQLRQTFMAFQEKTGEVVQAVVLCGGTSRLPGIDHFLSTELRKNVSFLDCLDFPFNQLSDSAWCRPIATTGVSLAYRGVIGSGVKDIQFRRGDLAYKGEVKELVGLAKQVGFLLAVILSFMIGSSAISYWSLKGRVKKELGRVGTFVSEVLPETPKKSLTNPTAILSTLSGKITETEERKKKISDETELSILEVLREFSSVLPPRETLVLDLDDLTIISRRIRLQGRTNSFEAVEQIKTALAKSKVFKNIATENVKKGRGDEVRFNMSIEVGEKEEGEGA